MFFLKYKVKFYNHLKNEKFRKIPNKNKNNNNTDHPLTTLHTDGGNKNDKHQLSQLSVLLMCMPLKRLKRLCTLTTYKLKN